MEPSSNNKLAELQKILTKLPLKETCISVMPEMGVKWKDVSETVRKVRLPMTSANVARVLCRHVAKHTPEEEICEIVARLRLKLVITQNRTWHVIRLMDSIRDEPVSVLCKALPDRLYEALRSIKTSNKKPEVETVNHGDLVYIGAQLSSPGKEGSVLYMVSPPGEPVALVNSLAKRSLIRACVAGLGYNSYEDAKLYGRDITSLIRTSNRTDQNMDDINEIPIYDPIPIADKNGIDYTYKIYNERYVESIMGPDPPLLTDLSVSSRRSFFDPTRIDRSIPISLRLKSDDIGTTLKGWVGKGVLAPTSELLQIFRHLKSNRICDEE